MTADTAGSGAYKMKILIKQKKGLGNQLFEYAAGLYFAKKYGAGLAIIKEPECRAISFGHPRPFLLSKFLITTPVRDMNSLDRLLCSTSERAKLAAASARLLFRAQLVKPHFSTDWVFQPSLPDTRGKRRIYLDGHFQSHQFSQNVEQQLRSELVLRDAPAGKNLEMLEQIRASECPVSIHIRRGDYTLIYNGRDALPMTYYRNAIATICDDSSRPTFFVFSDDIAFARANLPGDRNMFFIGHNDEVTAHEDLRLMSACRHNIIANSTFSWWGAWLNPNPEKQVLAPNRWLDPLVPHPDLIPPTWRRIPVEAQ
jgi:hypothetical protein